ncbi:MAG TPA: TadE/TadG family type IV pilus assembly protein [Acidimicrobiales bacterium]
MKRLDRGQAALELALLVPVLVVLLLAVVQVVVVGRDQIVVVHAAREGARAAAVAPASHARADALRAVQAAARGLDRAELLVVTVLSSDRVRVTVSYGPAAWIPIFGPLTGRRTLTATATMAVER